MESKINKLKVHWENLYQKKNDSDFSWFQNQATPSFNLISKYCDLKKNSLIDVGSGTSRLVNQLINRKEIQKITLLDISQNALNTNKRRIGTSKKVYYINSDVTDWKPIEIFDIWHDRAVFHFILSDMNIKKYVKVLENATKMNSIIIIGTFALDGPEKCSGLKIRRYSSQDIEKILGKNFKLIDSLNHQHLTPSNKVQNFCFSVFKNTENT